MVNTIKILGEAWDSNWGLKHGEMLGKLEAKDPAFKKSFDELVNQLKRYKKETSIILFPEKARLQMQIDALNRGRKIGLKKAKAKMSKQKKYWK